MYSTCLFCNAALGSNESIEHFPVGRRLAFDAAKGRLWVVCRKCERWNLSPIEERWEAMEECERIFRDTRLRVSTDNIGLARLREGLELVRIGEPQRPEFAAWRYGDQFGRRRRNRIAKTALGVGALGAVITGGAIVGVSIGSFGWFLWQMATTAISGSPDAIVARVPFENDTIKVKRKHLGRVSLLPSDEGDAPFALSLKYKQRHVTVTGETATRAASLLLPHINQFGANRRTVEDAVARIEHAGDSERFIRGTASRAAEGRFVALAKLEPWERLAFEMALHEEAERRALEGELATLEVAWREAEEIAAISDNLLVPSGIQEFVGKLSRRG
jgi:hypothetical protein